MQISKVSFGTLVAVYGTPKKMKNIDKKISSSAMIKDLTSTFQNSYPSGVLAQAAQSGNKVKLYITGEERKSIEKETQGWKTIGNLIDNIQDYFDANKMSISEIVNAIFKRK